MPRHNVKSSRAATDSQPTSDEVAQVQDEPAMFGLTSINGVPVISAEELYEAFKDNEVAANKKYGGKTYCVKGIIEGFQTSVIGEEPVVNLSSGYIFPVSCYFSKSNEDEPRRLHRLDIWPFRPYYIGKRGFRINLILFLLAVQSRVRT